MEVRSYSQLHEHLASFTLSQSFSCDCSWSKMLNPQQSAPPIRLKVGRVDGTGIGPVSGKVAQRKTLWQSRATKEHS